MKDKEIVRLLAKIEKIENANKKESKAKTTAKKPAVKKTSVAKKPVQEEWKKGRRGERR